MVKSGVSKNHLVVLTKREAGGAGGIAGKQAGERGRELAKCKK